MISLIVATINRVAELERLLASLDVQTNQDFEVIVVDQNPDDRIVEVLKSHSGLRILHLHSEPGLSQARNVGLSHANGDVLAIPDDDCWYPRDLLSVIDEWFRRNREYAVISAISRDEHGSSVGPNWPQAPTEVTRLLLWRCPISTTIFLRRELTRAVGDFNQMLGVGANSPYQSGEETDYLLRALDHGFRIWYEPSVVVHHPKLHSLDRLRTTTYSYALGSGYVMGTHNFSFLYLAGRLVRSLGGAAVSLLHGDPTMAGIYLKRFNGQLRGYIAGRTS